jgi:cellulose synthase/poly-beta-1,6-N-acetylglucosamine synthase-like glycosyltransferase
MKTVQLIFGVGTLFFILLAASGWPALNIVILTISLLFLLQGALTVYVMLSSWETKERLQEIEPPLPGFERPRHSFSLIIPARYEEQVIGDTMRAMSRLDYPQKLLEVLVVVRADDLGTIREVERALAEIDRSNFKLIVCDGYPVNKAHALNVGLDHARHEVVGVFDAEDEPHRQILRLVDLKLVRDRLDVVQAGVQLINLNSTWFSALAALGYYFWYKSVLPFFSQLGSTPLGGNTVFFKKAALVDVGGWDDQSLTEDADIGVRLSLAGRRIGMIYQERIATLEEAPPDVNGLLRQRCRWDQGFLRIILRGDWLQFGRLSQQFLIVYLFLQPLIHLITLMALIGLPYLVLRVRVPLGLAMVSFLPGYLLVLQIGIFVSGLFDLSHKYRQSISPWTVAKVIFGYLPYQAILGLAFIRAAARLVLGFSWWEKTTHLNAHRFAAVPPPPPLPLRDWRSFPPPPENSLNGVIYLGSSDGF